MSSLAELQTYLSELKTALHDLRLGRLPRRITSPDGRQTEYNPVSIDALREEIVKVKAEIEAASGRPNPRRPIRFSF